MRTWTERPSTAVNEACKVYDALRRYLSRLGCD